MKVVALSGGVGGAKLVDGLAATLPAESLTVIVNTGDDFDHWGLRICPDLDTVMYTLSGLADAQRGWGLADERWDTLEMVSRLGGPDWFRLGNRDLGVHLVRTSALADGASLTAVTDRLRRALGVSTRLLPMSDDVRQTRIVTRDDGTMAFQDWLVGARAGPAVDQVLFEGSERPSAETLSALDDADVVVITPSNPYVSIDPILTLAGVTERLKRRPVIAVSPIVGGAAVKGPLAEMIPRLAGEPASAAAIARHYGALLDAFVCETGDAPDAMDAPAAVLETSTVMRDTHDRRRLAEQVLAFAEEQLS